MKTIALLITLVFSLASFAEKNSEPRLDTQLTTQNTVTKKSAIKLANLILSAASFAHVKNEEYNLLGTESLLDRKPEAKGLVSQALRALGDFDLYFYRGLQRMAKQGDLNKSQEFTLIITPTVEGADAALFHQVDGRLVQIAELVEPVAQMLLPLFSLEVKGMPRDAQRRRSLEDGYEGLNSLSFKTDTMNTLSTSTLASGTNRYEYFYEKFMSLEQSWADRMRHQAELGRPLAFIMDFKVQKKGSSRATLDGHVQYQLYLPGLPETQTQNMDNQETGHATITEVQVVGYDKLLGDSSYVPVIRVELEKDFTKANEIQARLGLGLFDETLLGTDSNSLIPLNYSGPALIQAKGTPDIPTLGNYSLNVDVHQLAFTYKRKRRANPRRDFSAPLNFEINYESDGSHLVYNILNNEGEHHMFSPIYSWDNIGDREDHGINVNFIGEEYILALVAGWLTKDDMSNLLKLAEEEGNKFIKNQSEKMKSEMSLR